MARLLAAALVLLSCPAAAAPAPAAEVVARLPALRPAVGAPAPARLVGAARRYLRAPYRWSGRTRRGVDCVGLVFAAFRDAHGVPVSAFDRHNRSNAAVAARIGRVAGVVSAEEAGRASVRPGDVLFFLWPAPNPAEPAFARVAGAEHWVWHVGLATGGGRVLHASPWAGEVIEEPIEALVREASFEGMAVVRPGRRG